ncbi:MAG: hypothetical protein ACR2QC_02290 [Gammaproteobacteria bacterium]
MSSWTIPNLAVSENIKNRYSGESRNFFRRKANPRFSPLHPSHSCEGRNLHAEGGNCTITRRYAAAEIPAFAGMGRVVYFGTGAEIQSTAIPGESRNLIRRKANRLRFRAKKIPAFAGMAVFN